MAGASMRHESDDARLRALAFWVGHHQASQPAPRIGPAGPTPGETAAERERRIGDLVRMVPELKQLAKDSRPAVRATVARSFAILATAHRAPADREIWRLLLGLAKYDEDPDVRAAAEAALAALERYGAVAAKAS
ncbi:HEAT repeat domain-containing protein [Demequina activiva]|nr:HEAT repeat domain-containing protein [Demequina activiva]